MNELEACFICKKYKLGKMARFSVPGFGKVWACNNCAVWVKYNIMNKRDETPKDAKH